MNELQRRLKDVMDSRFGGVASKASRAAGLHSNAVVRVLEDPHHQSTLDTLDKFCQAYGWDLRDCVFWALDRPVTPLTEGPGDQVIQQILAREGYSELTRTFIRDVLERARPQPTEVASTESS